ncbi:T9SS type B sorting domain-containing protein [Urechidicola croceus]|uniref:PKD domain-containing protein n=1 Tax=Urechidicola croceus TaxID=1850246 RepID=A0A1D8P3T2_9FLAO|nr:T9SS type B sorting domain-containing protein [Urechidicola croceus]AOW19242.1 hypothetical protein LPB138_00430 [Urechidicola croceus]
MKKIFFILIAVIIFINTSYSQREAANWYFGERAGLNFNSGTPVPLLNGQLDSAEGCSSISDKNGNLLFYTNGMTVWDRNHQIMPNGTGLIGHHSSTQAAMIVPKPNTPSILYIFTVDKPSYFLSEGDPISGINYSVVDMVANGGNGDVLSDSKNIHLVTYDPSNSVESEYKSSEKITAVLHDDEMSYWVITHFVNKFYAFRIDENGVNPTPVISTVNQTVNPIIDDQGVNKSAIGYLKISPDGKKLAIAHSSTTLGSPRSGTRKSGTVYLYNFDDATGIVSGGDLLVSNEYPYGVEFSPRSTKLYITSNIFNSDDSLESSNLYQFNMDAADIPSSKRVINNSNNVAGGLQLAIDGKIYRAGYPSGTIGTRLSIINQPDANSSSVDYSHNSFDINRSVTLGLPPFIQSLFLVTFDYEFTCFGQSTHFIITSQDPYDTVLWDFGDGTQSTEESPNHRYTAPGTYTVTLTKYINGVESARNSKQVTIYARPQVPTGEYELIQCDTDSNPLDGLSTFNLGLANDYVHLEAPADVEVFYYEDITSLDDDIDNQNSLSYIYDNISANQLIYVKVVMRGSDCYEISYLRLRASEPEDMSMSPFYGCDLGDEKAEYNLVSKRQEIIDFYGLSTNTTINFFLDESSANLGRYPIVQDVLISEEKTIYIRTEIDNTCLGIGSIELRIHDFPSIEEEIEFDICGSEFPYTIGTEINSAVINDFSFEWNTGEITPEIDIHSSGIYSVIITEISTQCSKTKYITVNQILEPTLDNVVISDGSLGYNITVNLIQEGAYEYALDDINGFYQTLNTFYNVLPGQHTVFVKDPINCETIEVEVYIIHYPKFFTPNRDGYNDFWQIKGLNEDIYQITYIHIYDRFGKFIANVDPKGDGWDGFYNGKALPSTDYWFVTQIVDIEGNIQDKQGHFSLIRR